MAALACSLFAAGVASGGETNVAGSAQLDYLAVPTNSAPRSTTFDGFTTELSMKLVADVNDNLVVETKVCFACHGVEIGVAIADVTINDHLSIRVGRFSPAFGDFPARHDPANHRTSDKPLPYDMGRMLRLREWNMSVLPAPYVDNGVELRGTLELGRRVELDWAGYLVGGLRASQDATDVDFIQSRSGDWYYVDNNSMPAAGGRVVLNLLADDSSVRLGASAMTGSYDPARELDYVLLGGDVSWRSKYMTLRAEYLLRRQHMALGDHPGDDFLYGPRADGTYDTVAIKDGFYLEAEVPLGDFELVGRFDGMTRIGNVTVASSLTDRSWILRGTLAASYRASANLRWKASGELYQFSDFDSEAAFHLGLVASF